jgi:ribosome-associated translation inhibitor RaiA
MKIRIRPHDLLTEALRTHTVRQLGFALSRFGGEIGEVVVRFSERNEPRRRADKRCSLEVSLARAVKVEEVDADLFVAINRVADRASRAVGRVLALEREGVQVPLGPPGSGRSKP